jgi:hypothetical protein
MNQRIDFTKAHITLADGTIWQVLDEHGEFNDQATAQAIWQYMEAE